MNKICAVVASRANYGRIKYLLKAIEQNKNLELQLVVGASILLHRFGNAIDIIREDGFKPNKEIHYIVEGETLLTQAKSTGLGVIELASAFNELKPDYVITVADRFETMSTAIASTYQNIPLIHLQGGEVTGNIDNRVRHSITQLADYHFVASNKAQEKLKCMDINPNRIFNYGCPSMDVLDKNSLALDEERLNKYKGVGGQINWKQKYILMVQHPVTTSYGDGYDQIIESLHALKSLDEYQKIILWPNPDAGSDDVSKGIRQFREKYKPDKFYFYKNFSPEDYAIILNNASCCIGNSSSFIREGSFLGVPAVIVGDRQCGRETGNNIEVSDYNRNEITEKINKQLKNGKYKKEFIFGDGNAGKNIALEINNICNG